MDVTRNIFCVTKAKGTKDTNSIPYLTRSRLEYNYIWKLNSYCTECQCETVGLGYICVKYFLSSKRKTLAENALKLKLANLGILLSMKTGLETG